MKPLTSDEIRSKFLEFFESRQHELVTSSPLVPQNDPTLLFTNAGMVQFKDVFTGREKRAYQRATSSQKCVRAGGKHNDLENVGYTARHHTFFEMLGNFSFGDYFKKEAIEFAWKFIIEELGMPPERLAVTVFRGEGEIPADDEAEKHWQAVGVLPERIFRLGKSENYWQMGETGPQGPCSEIHYYLGDDLENAFVAEKVEASDGWFEIWNLVFMQFDKAAPDAALTRLPKPCVDTGAGLERLAVVLQGKHSNYETDVFTDLIASIAKDAGKNYGHTESEDDVSMRVIADHARATAFLVADGVQPSNEGRGYVLRRIMRRAIRHGDRLGFDDLFFFRPCLQVIERLKSVYPELEGSRSLIEKVAKNEEQSFRRTLARGLKLLEKEIAALEAKKQTSLDRMFVARMYDTFGFPIDLTRVIATEHGMSVDEDDARKAVTEIQQSSNDADLGSDASVDSVWFAVREEVGATEFTGYTQDETEAKVLAIVVEGERVDSAEAETSVELVLDRTAFYGESGGQVGDRGWLRGAGIEVHVDDTRKPRSDLHVHVGKVTSGKLSVGQTVTASVDATLRNATRKNHSATHLLHLALREVLGDHVQQKGSLVAPDRLRFDFSHFEPLKPDEIEAIERRANEIVLGDAEAVTEELDLDEAKSRGAVMLFGEKYADRVRVLQIGDSIELCGGNHVSRAGEIGLVKIVGDSNIAAGIRRIEAVTGLNALAWVQARTRALDYASSLAKATPEELPGRVEKLVKRSKELERELEKAKAQAAMGQQGSGDILDKVEEIDGVKVLIHQVDGTSIKALRSVSDQIRDRLQSGVVILGAKEGDKGGLLVAVTKDLSKSIKAGDLIKQATAPVDGWSGGGRPDFAQGGGGAGSLDETMDQARAALVTRLQDGL